MVEQIIRGAKKEGTYDLGIMELTGSKVYMEKPGETVHVDPVTGTKTLHYVVNVDRGIAWSASQEMLANIQSDKENEVGGDAEADKKADQDENKTEETKKSPQPSRYGSSYMTRHRRKGIKTGYYMTRYPFQGRYFVLLATEKPTAHPVPAFIHL